MSSQPASSQPLTTKRRVLLVDDHPIIRHGLAELINAEPDLEVCGEADNATQALEMLRDAQPDTAVIDIVLPGVNGIELAKMIKAEKPDLPLLIVSMHDESQYAIRALKAGAQGYVMKAEAVPHVIEGLRHILRGETYLGAPLDDRLIIKTLRAQRDGGNSPVNKLTQREFEVLELLGRGYSTREIGDQLNLSIKTVETHRGHIKEKLGFQSTREMIRFAMDWITQEEPDTAP